MQTNKQKEKKETKIEKYLRNKYKKCKYDRQMDSIY